MVESMKHVAGTGSSAVVERCQICASADLRSVLFLGYLPPVNQMRPLGQRPHEQSAYPAEWLFCPRCQLVQLGLVVDAGVLFPPDYPYTSGTTKILCDNFAELYRECSRMIELDAKTLVIDIGSNDGTLLRNFKEGGHRVLGIEPTDAGKLAIQAGIDTESAFFRPDVVARVKARHGTARIVTAANVFAHIEDVHEVVNGIVDLLDEDGVFISESHYVVSLVETLQYDTIYHEHLRYYSLQSLSYLLDAHGLEVIHTKRIPTHGGSIRVYAARKGRRQVQASVAEMQQAEQAAGIGFDRLEEFKRQVVLSKLELHTLLLDIKRKGQRIYGVGAPSRASTLINYVGLDDGIVDRVVEVKGSRKVNKYMPGTLIPVVDEGCLFQDQPDYALLLSWHIADELMPKLTQKGFKGGYIVPLPQPKIVRAG